MALTREQQEMLEFERRWPRLNGDKVRAVREYFDLSTADYERLLAKVLELPSAREYDPALVEAARRQRRGAKWYLEKQQGDWA